MQISWFTVVAQIINFLVLVFLLKKFLYGPIVKAMDERQERIDRQEKESLFKFGEGEMRMREYEEKSAALNSQKEEILSIARKEAEEERKEYLQKSRAVVDEQKKAWEHSFIREKDLYLMELKKEIGRQSCQIARRALQDLASADLEKMVIDVFIDKLKNLSEEERARINESLVRRGKTVLVNSAFPVTEEQTRKIRAVLGDKFEQMEETEFLVSPELLCGIEIEANGNHLGWNIDEYLRSFSENLLRGLEESHKENPEQGSNENNRDQGS